MVVHVTVLKLLLPGADKEILRQFSTVVSSQVPASWTLERYLRYAMHSADTTADAILARSLQGFSSTPNMEVVCVVIVHVSLLYYEQSVIRLLVFCFRRELCCFIFISASILALLPCPGQSFSARVPKCCRRSARFPPRKVSNSSVCK
jgi:hypothetical protein